MLQLIHTKKIINFGSAARISGNLNNKRIVCGNYLSQNQQMQENYFLPQILPCPLKDGLGFLIYRLLLSEH